MEFDTDALVIGAGAAGSAAAILLAAAGWRVVLVEQHAYPRRKVCGECIAAGNLPLLDALGVGAAFRSSAGPELRRIGWIDEVATLSAEMPPCDGPYAYGRALGRDRLDALLLRRARGLGVNVLQPARVLEVSGAPGRFACRIEPTRTLRMPVLIDAHGSWERGPVGLCGTADPAREPRRNSDLFAFKANFRGTRLDPGFLPVLALPGGYGGMVLGDAERTTLACCIRRDALAACRAASPGETAGVAVQRFLVARLGGVADVLRGAEREGAWLSVGPLRPGVRLGPRNQAFRIGNAAGESHPLIGEGISMALQSATLLTALLTQQRAPVIAGPVHAALQAAYAQAWRTAFNRRLRFAALYAHTAMRPALATPVRRLVQRWPSLLALGARLAGKARRAAATRPTTAETA